MRHAVYLAPPEASELEGRAAAWLGRDLAGQPVARPDVPGFTTERLQALTKAPRHYGFHATLKPPFALAQGATLDGLTGALGAFAAARSRFEIPPLHVEPLDGFLCLRSESPALDELAATCVRAFDSFRAPQTAAELAARRAGGLSRRQEEMLTRWGYPYVLDQFRFHMTLTGRIADDAERADLAAWLAEWLAPAVAGPMTVREVALYSQADRTAPFVLTRRFAFGVSYRRADCLTHHQAVAPVSSGHCGRGQARSAPGEGMDEPSGSSGSVR